MNNERKEPQQQQQKTNQQNDIYRGALASMFDMLWLYVLPSVSNGEN